MVVVEAAMSISVTGDGIEREQEDVNQEGTMSFEVCSNIP